MQHQQPSRLVIQRVTVEQAKKRLRLLIVEDEMMVSMLLEDMLHDMGHEVVGPVTKLEAAVEKAAVADIDGAVLDLNLNGVNTYPVADVLQKRGIPFIFATGYGSSALVERYRGVPTLQKPFLRSEMEAALRTMK